MFQDGVIAQAVDEVVSQGVTYFSAAGNQARLSYDRPFVPGSNLPPGAFPGFPAFLGGTPHVFGGDVSGGIDFRQRIRVQEASSFLLVLQWDSPFLSVSGVGTQTDLDVYLLSINTGQIVRGVTTDNVSSGDPVEILSFSNVGPPADFEIVIVNHPGPESRAHQVRDLPARQLPTDPGVPDE